MPNQDPSGPGPLSQTALRNPFRWKPGLFILVAGIVGIALIRLLVSDQTFRIMFQYYYGAVSLAAAIVWWLGYSQIPRRQRVAWFLLGIAILGGTAFATIRQVNFDGAMAAHFEFRWQRSAEAERDAWLNDVSNRVTEAALFDGTLTITEKDWPRYCGADGSRVVREPLREREWSQHPPKELWRHPIGEGWSSFAVVGERLFTQEQRGPEECIVCYHADTGDELWVHADSIRHETVMGGIATPTVTETGLYALGATGLLNCLNPVTGQMIWKRNICDDCNTSPPAWGYSSSPLIFDGTVIIDSGSDDGRAVIAYDRKSADVVWATGSHRAGYSSPRLESFGQQTNLLVFHGDGLLAMDPTSGNALWEYPFTNMYHVNAAQPMRTGEYLFVGSGYDGKCVALDPMQIINGVPAEVWPPNRNLKLKFNEAVERDGFVYGLDDGILCCIDAGTGKRKWKRGRYRYGQVLLWDDVLVVQAERGEVVLVEANPAQHIEIARIEGLSRPANDVQAKVWNVPVINRGRLYIRSADEVACLQLP